MQGKYAMLTGLLMLLLVSALAVIYSKYRSRQVFMAIQNVEKELDQYEVKWGQLQLEQTTLTEHNRVERLARKQLSMTMPEREKIVFIKP
jgi:cell division protein FtsL